MNQGVADLAAAPKSFHLWAQAYLPPNFFTFDLNDIAGRPMGAKVKGDGVNGAIQGERCWGSVAQSLAMLDTKKRDPFPGVRGLNGVHLGCEHGCAPNGKGSPLTRSTPKSLHLMVYRSGSSALPR